MESAHLVLGRRLGLSSHECLVSSHKPFVQGWWKACGGDVRTSVGGVVVGEMMGLVPCCVHGCIGC